MISLMKKEFKLSYNKSIINSLMNIWGNKYNNKLYISKKIFINKLFSKPDGFLRDINIT